MNSSNNGEALKSYTQLIKTYPQSGEADEATDIIKSIYVEEGKPEEYVKLMNENGKTVSVNEADSLNYTAAVNKYNAGDCAAAITAFNNYTSKYAAGAFILDANFQRSECYQKNKDFVNALTLAMPM